MTDQWRLAQVPLDIRALGAILALSFGMAAIALGIDWLFGQVVQAGQVRWVVEPLLFVGHVQYFGSGSPASASIIGAGALLALLFIYAMVRHRIVAGLTLLDVAVALFSAGALANLVEIQVAGGVSDYLGIHPFGGIYSTGDVAMSIGAALLPISLGNLFARGSGPNGWIVALVLIAGLFVLGLQDRPILLVGVLALSITAIGMVVVALRSLGVRQRES